jgi:GAF domain-containing protein
VRPIPQTIETATQLDRNLGDEGELLSGLQSVGDEVSRVVPECIGLSLAWLEHGVTFTLAATEADIATLDGVQYIDGGPCVDAVREGRGIETARPGLLEEDPWRLFAEASAAFGVHSTLTLPLTDEGRIVGSVNLYGATADCFEGHHAELARILGASAAGATRNADLSFSTRRQAEESPDRLRAEEVTHKAVGVLAVRLEVDVETAQERLKDAAQRAGIPTHQLAEAVIRLHV